VWARAVAPGEEQVLEKERYLFGDGFGNEGETTVPVRVVVRRIGSEEAEDPFLILDTRGIDSEEGSTFYRKRWSFEPSADVSSALLRSNREDSVWKRPT
jgi:hypothetical protein